MECQTEDYGGLLSRIWTWLQERIGNSQNASAFFGSGNANELSFGRQKESEENLSAAHFGNGPDIVGGSREKVSGFGEPDPPRNAELALKTLDARLLGTISDGRSESPISNDIFNKSGQNDTESQADTRGKLLSYRNIPIRRQTPDDSIELNCENHEEINPNKNFKIQTTQSRVKRQKLRTVAAKRRSPSRAEQKIS